eukprot:364389-Chlamydomonas_euryale.AAC.4
MTDVHPPTPHPSGASSHPQIPSSEAYEHSEMLMYKSRVLQEGGRLQEALDVLIKYVRRRGSGWARKESEP